MVGPWIQSRVWFSWSLLTRLTELTAGVTVCAALRLMPTPRYCWYYTRTIRVVNETKTSKPFPDEVEHVSGGLCNGGINCSIEMFWSLNMSNLRTHLFFVFPVSVERFQHEQCCPFNSKPILKRNRIYHIRESNWTVSLDSNPNLTKEGQNTHAKFSCAFPSVKSMRKIGYANTRGTRS